MKKHQHTRRSVSRQANLPHERDGFKLDSAAGALTGAISALSLRQWARESSDAIPPVRAPAALLGGS